MTSFGDFFLLLPNMDLTTMSFGLGLAILLAECGETDLVFWLNSVELISYPSHSTEVEGVRP